MKYLINTKTKQHYIQPGMMVPYGPQYDEVEADSEGWIAHTGTECPLPEDARCEVKFGNGTIIIWDSVGRCWWHNTALKAYRPILAEKVQEPEKSDWDRKCEEAVKKALYPELTANKNRLLDRLQSAHHAAQTIPDLEAELREVLGSMGYDLVARRIT